MRRIFWGFCRNWFFMSPLHYLSGRSDFGFEFAEIFVFKKLTPRYHRYGESPTLRIGDTGSRRLPVSLSRGVDDSQHHWYAESATPRITDAESRLLNFYKRKLSVSMIRRVVDSPHQWYGESPTPRILESKADSANHQYGESTTPRIVESGSRRLRVSGDTGVAIEKKIYLASIFSTLNV